MVPETSSSWHFSCRGEHALVLVPDALLGGRSDVGPELTGVLCVALAWSAMTGGWRALCVRVGVWACGGRPPPRCVCRGPGPCGHGLEGNQTSRTWMIQSTTLGP